MPSRTLFIPLLLLAAPLFAQDPKADPKSDPPKADDPVAAQLLKDKEAYVAATEKAKADLLKAFDKYHDSVKNNKSLKLEAQLAQLEKIEAEKKAFEESGAVPTLAGLKVALSEYRTAQKKAELTCKVAFEKAGKAYRDRGDVKAAGLILDEMKEFLAEAASATAVPMVIRCGNSNLVLGLEDGKTEDRTRLATAEYAKGDQTMLWKKVPAGDGWLYIENVKTGLVMTAAGKDNAAEVFITKRETPASDLQLWKLTPVPTFRDTVRVIPKASPRPIGIWRESKDPGTMIVLWDDQNQNHRYFGFFPPK
jgi:hypothetical protein